MQIEHLATAARDQGIEEQMLSGLRRCRVCSIGPTTTEALEEFGIRCVIAPSFGDIFYANCLQNGLLPIVLDAPSIARLADIAKDGTPLEVDLRALEIRAPGVPTQRFEFDQARQQALIEGLDEIDQTLRMKAGIDAFRAADRGARSWAYPIL